jgi:hypothetical protein
MVALINYPRKVLSNRLAHTEPVRGAFFSMGLKEESLSLNVDRDGDSGCTACGVARAGSKADEADDDKKPDKVDSPADTAPPTAATSAVAGVRASNIRGVTTGDVCFDVCCDEVIMNVRV